jgi:hypothetical protein
VAAFQYCKGLKNLLIPSSVTRIECAIFVQCTRLISLELPEGLGIIDLGGRVDPHDEEPKPPNGELRNIYACRSLVNLVMPSEQNVEQLDDDEAFMESLKLRHVASNFDDLARKLQHRFDDLPVLSILLSNAIGCSSDVWNRYTNKEHILIIEHLRKL